MEMGVLCKDSSCSSAVANCKKNISDRKITSFANIIVSKRGVCTAEEITLLATHYCMVSVRDIMFTQTVNEEAGN